MTNPDRNELVKLAAELGAMSMRLSYEQDRMTVVAACELLRRLASSDGGVKGEPEPEPVAWQYRFRPRGSVEWSDWGDCGPGNRAPKMRTGAYEIEERPLYLAPPADAGMREALDIAFCAMKDLRDALHREPSVHGRKWVHLGSSLNYAIRKAELALTAPGATTKSDGGVESRRHAETGNKSGAVPEAEQSSSATSFVRASGPEDKTLKPRAGVASGPSDPSHEPYEETPFAYAYEYPSYNGPVIRLGTYGREINGSKPIRAIPLYSRPVSLNREAIVQAANIARGHAHHSLWNGLLPYGWDETTEVFGRGLADRIADAIIALIEGKKL